MIIGFVFYYKIICKTEINRYSFFIFSILAGVVDALLLSSVTTRSLLMAYIVNYSIDFIVLAVFALIAFKVQNIERKEKSKTKSKYYPSFWTLVIAEYIISTAATVCVIGFINEWDYTVNSIIGIVFSCMISSILSTYLYFFPYLIANKKNHRQTRAIYILNIFAGWTIIAWIIALIWAFTESSEKKIIQQTIQNSNADELLKYKNLLDLGIITQEEFDNKKKQLLL